MVPKHPVNSGFQWALASPLPPVSAQAFGSPSLTYALSAWDRLQVLEGVGVAPGPNDRGALSAKERERSLRRGDDHLFAADRMRCGRLLDVFDGVAAR